MKDRITQLIAARRRLARQMPDPSIALAGSLMSRMVRCNKPGCRFCEKCQGPGHGPIWILSVSKGSRRVRQIPVPKEMKKEVAEGLRRWADVRKVLKQIAQVNQALLEERKRR